MCRMLLVAAVAMPLALQGQATGSTPRLVRASGEGVVSVVPDRAKVSVGAVTQAATAQEAAAQNASQVEAVLAQLRSLLGASADIKTISYSLTPNYRYPQGGGPPTLVNYTASNTVEVTLADLSLIGKVIDTAAQAGANQIQSLRFTVADPEPLRARALAAAAKQARARAEAIASGLGVRLAAILTAQEGTVVRYTDTREVAAGAPQTPIETGLVEVRATVTVEIELAP